MLPVVTSWGPPPLADHPVFASRSCRSWCVAAAYQPRNVTKNEHITDRETRVQGHGHNRVFVQYVIAGCCVNELDRIWEHLIIYRIYKIAENIFIIRYWQTVISN